jgi:DNA-binding IclR family transcriptional regulator
MTSTQRPSTRCTWPYATATLRSTSPACPVGSLCRWFSAVGSRLPLHATGVGKVLLAYAPGEIQTAVLAKLTRITPFTVTQPGKLEAELRRVRQEGFAQTNEEMSLGACSMAVPVRAGEQVVAAIGMVVPSLKRDRVRLVAALQVAAQGIGRSLG